MLGRQGYWDCWKCFPFGFGATLFLLNAGCTGAWIPERKIARQEGRKAGSCSAGEKVYVLCLSSLHSPGFCWWSGGHIAGILSCSYSYLCCVGQLKAVEVCHRTPSFQVPCYLFPTQFSFSHRAAAHFHFCSFPPSPLTYTRPFPLGLATVLCLLQSCFFLRLVVKNLLLLWFK